MTLDITMAHSDVTMIHPLITGAVEPEGVDLTILTKPDNPGKLYRRLWKYEEVDVSEMGMGTLITLSMNQDYPFTAIPVFTDRIFRHAYMYTHRDSDIDDPSDLEKGRIGTQSWSGSAGTWMRGIAQEHYGLNLESVEWYLEGPLKGPRSVPDRFDTEIVSDQSFEQIIDLLADGELDAVFHPRLPDGLQDPDSEIEWLFDEPMREEQEYYEQTGIFPMMHTVAIHDDLLERNPWIAQNILEAFQEAQDIVMEKFQDPDWTPFVWGLHHLYQQKSDFRDNPWEYGLTDQNRRSLDKFLEYAYEQGLATARYESEDLFPQTIVQRLH